MPGFNIKIPHGLSSPNVIAYAGGISRQFQNRAVVRADYSYRDYRDFYSQRIDTSTGTVTDEFGDLADLAIVENTNNLKRRYSGVTLSATYRIGARTDIGGNYTLSRLWGNFDGENVSSGPLATDIFQYPEYRQMSWYAPEGDLSADQRHRSTMWLNYGVPKVNGLTLSLLQDLASGLPYGAVGVAGGERRGQCDSVRHATPATRTRRATPARPTTTRRATHSTPRHSKRTDLAVNYSYAVGAGSRKADLFFQAQILNVFNTFDLCGCGSTVFSNGGADGAEHDRSNRHRRRRVQPVHDDACRRHELGQGGELRHAAEPIRVHVAADTPAVLRRQVLAGLRPSRASARIGHLRARTCSRSSLGSQGCVTAPGSLSTRSPCCLVH